MKLQGKTIEGVNEIDIIIPRGNDISNAIVLKARAILDWSLLDKLLPAPKPRVKILPGGKRELDEKNPEFVKRREDYWARRSIWIVLESLKATPGLEFEKVIYEKPDTYLDFEKEMKEAGFSFVEVQRIIAGCMQVNALSEQMLDQARADFLSFQEKQAELLSSQEVDQDSMPSGEPANASESSLPESETAGKITQI